MLTTTMLRRRALALLLATLLLAACAGPPTPMAATAATAPPPIVFVHGNGDTAALWTTTLWRFESNGWPRERLHAVDFAYPLARSDDGKPQEGRSSSTEQMQQLAAAVDALRRATGADRVVLVGNSRGGIAIRNYIQNGGGGKTVSHAVLGGTPNHGVWSNPAFQPGSEFNGAGPLLTALNAPKGPNGDEVTPGPAWLTIRSDDNDKYAQPDGVWIGAKGQPTHVSFDGPALKGASNVVLPGRDHREVSVHAEAFAATYLFISGRAAATLAVTAQQRVVLDGKVSGFTAGAANNLPLVGARVAVYGVDAATGARRGAALSDRSVGADGRWGPVETDSRAPLEFVIEAPGFAVTHIYRSPFVRSSDIVHLRPERLSDADKSAAALISLSRPRGYFGLPRDTVLLDGKPAAGIPSGVAGVAMAKLRLDDGAGRSVVADYRSGAISEHLVGLAWPARDNHVVMLELTQ